MKQLNAMRIFFPAAALQASITVPLSVYVALSNTGWPPGLIGTGHGHEMLLGFIPALLAGYTLGNQSIKLLMTLFTLWFFARIGYTFFPQTMAGQWLSPLFTLLLSFKVLPRYMSAKKWRNKSIIPIIAIICFLPLLWLLERNIAWEINHKNLMLGTVQFIILLMSFIAGRIIAPAATGEIRKQGGVLQARVQPTIEALLIFIIAASAIAELIPGYKNLSGYLIITAGILLFIRLFRWQLWKCITRPDLIGMGIGYGWLALGSICIGLTILGNHAEIIAIHIVTIGALGSLSSSIIVERYLKKSTKNIPPAKVLLPILSLITIATVSRILVGTNIQDSAGMLVFSALCWSSAYFWLFIVLITSNFIHTNNTFTSLIWRAIK